jgi:hypothetical protein
VPLEDVLVVTPVGASEPRASARDLLEPDGEPAFGAWHGSGGMRWLERTTFERRDGVLRRWVERYRVAGSRIAALERVAFDFDGATIVESRIERSASGDNVHPEPIALPAELERGVNVPILGGLAHVSLVHAGPVELTLGTLTARGRGLLLRAEEGGAARDQWSIAGVGEVWIGPRDGPPMRWLVGWERGGARLLGGLPDGWREFVLPPLP